MDKALKNKAKAALMICAGGIVEPPEIDGHNAALMAKMIWIRAADRVINGLDADRKRIAEYFAENGSTQGTKERRDELTKSLHISEPTAYRWLEEILTDIVIEALKDGAEGGGYA